MGIELSLRCLELPSSFDYVAFFANWIWPLLAAIIGGIISGIIIVIAVKIMQSPNLRISLVDDGYDGQADAKYVHLRVENVKTFWHDLVGGGTAVNCKCRVTLEDGKSFVTKWAAREPWGTQVTLDTSGKLVHVGVLDQQHMDQAKLEVLRPGEQKLIDIAVRLKGDSSCYVHAPENFSDPNYRPLANEVRPGTYRATAVFECDGYGTKPYRFRIVNGEGHYPDLLSLEDE
jgi:hypothetical protein